MTLMLRSLCSSSSKEGEMEGVSKKICRQVQGGRSWWLRGRRSSQAFASQTGPSSRSTISRGCMLFRMSDRRSHARSRGESSVQRTQRERRRAPLGRRSVTSRTQSRCSRDRTPSLPASWLPVQRLALQSIVKDMEIYTSTIESSTLNPTATPPSSLSLPLVLNSVPTSPSL
jgi:hypothetical protein